MSVPTDPGYELRRLVEVVSDQGRRLRVLESRRQTYVEEVTVVEVAGSMCAVEWPDGSQRMLSVASVYTPEVGDRALFLASPTWTGVLCQVPA